MRKDAEQELEDKKHKELDRLRRLADLEKERQRAEDEERQKELEDQHIKHDYPFLC